MQLLSTIALLFFKYFFLGEGEITKSGLSKHDFLHANDTQVEQTHPIMAYISVFCVKKFPLPLTVVALFGETIMSLIENLILGL